MWQVGEVGVCISDPSGSPVGDLFSWLMGWGDPPVVGKIYRVTAVDVCQVCGRESLAIDPEGRGRWHAEHFRKIVKSDLSISDMIKKQKVKEKEDA